MIEYKTLDAQYIYRTICDMHNKSSMPYIVYRDTVNYKNNLQNTGVCEGLNLCLEIIEPSTPDSIASCNLGHINLKALRGGHDTDGHGHGGVGESETHMHAKFLLQKHVGRYFFCQKRCPRCFVGEHISTSACCCLVLDIK